MAACAVCIGPSGILVIVAQPANAPAATSISIFVFISSSDAVRQNS
jgi:hypothetical protein